MATSPRAEAFQGLVRQRRPGVRAGLLASSLLAHAAIAMLASLPSPPRPPSPLPAAVAVAFVKPRPLPVAAPPRRPPKPVALKTSRGPRAMRAVAMAPPPPLAPSLPPGPAPLLAPAAPRPIVLSGLMISAVSGGFAGGRGTAPGGSASGGDIATRGAPGGDGTADVSQPPVVLNAGAVDIKRYYPPAALKSGLEGAVSLKLVIEADGTIVSVTVTHDPGGGLAEAALRAIREFRFSAGRLNGERVRAVIPFVIRFVSTR